MNIKFNSLEEMFDKLNTTCEYVVLQSFNEIFISNYLCEHDIDVLCKNKRQLIKILDAKKASKLSFWSHCYYVMIGDNKISIDIISTKENYLDENWCLNILNKRTPSSKNVYIPDEENQLYILIYRSLLQKKSISKTYQEKIQKLSKLNKIENISVKDYKNLLENYLTINNYSVPYPNDVLCAKRYELIDQKFIKNKFKWKVKKTVLLFLLKIYRKLK